MIASGSLSGGISSSIAGGNFWDGARQGIITSGLNHLAHSSISKSKSRLQKIKEKKANNLADKYERNDRKIMALSFTVEALLEVTDVGKLLTSIRESMAATYGNEYSKEVNEIYSHVIEIVRQIKEDVGGGRISDAYIYKTATFFGTMAIALQLQNSIVKTRIKILSEDIYERRGFAPKNRDYKFGRAGAVSSY